MVPATSEELFEYATKLYRKQDYSEMYAYLSEFAHLFPREAYRIYHWRMCAAALNGQTDQALNLFKQALEQGIWYGEDQLNDPDLNSLRDLPDFQLLASKSLEAQVAANAQSQPKRMILQPDVLDVRTTHPLLVVMHGNNSNLSETAQHWETTRNSGYFVLLAQSSQVNGQERYVWNDRERAVAEIIEHVEFAQSHYQIDPKRVILAGFSKGAQVAAWMALTDTPPVSGFLATAPYLPDVDTWKGEIIKTHPIRGYLVIGVRDQLSIEGPNALVDLMNQNGFPCKLEMIPEMAHEYPKNFPALLEKGLKFILNEN